MIICLVLEMHYLLNNRILWYSVNIYYNVKLRYTFRHQTVYFPKTDKIASKSKIIYSEIACIIVPSGSTGQGLNNIYRKGSK